MNTHTLTPATLPTVGHCDRVLFSPPFPLRENFKDGGGWVEEILHAKRRRKKHTHARTHRQGVPESPGPHREHTRMLLQHAGLRRDFT